MREIEHANRVWWFMRLRWLAVIGVISVVFFARKILGIQLASAPLYATAILIGAYNFLFFIYLKRVVNEPLADIPKKINRITKMQISLDLVALMTLVHFSGGIENPFIFYFIFHMVIASILFSRRASFLQATFAVLLFCANVSLEYFGILRHYCLQGFITANQHKNLPYIVGVSFVFITTLYITVYMATSIMKKLREKEKNLEEANKQLNEKDRIKSEYVLRVTHDIKEHLSAIQVCLEPVTKGITGALNEKQRNLLNRADERAGKLMFFVKALLELTSIKLNKGIEMSDFSVKRTIESAIGFVETKAKGKGIDISYDIAPGIDKLKGAEVYIEETIANLLANSVKYTPQHGKINILVKDKGDSVLIQIKDTGIGIPKEEIHKVFDEFYRAKNAREIEKDGTGLGLSIAKQVVEMHKGKIWVESQEGKGATFSIILPRQACLTRQVNVC